MVRIGLRRSTCPLPSCRMATTHDHDALRRATHLDEMPGLRLVQSGLLLMVANVVVGLLMPMRAARGSGIVKCGLPMSVADDPLCAGALDARIGDMVGYGVTFLATAVLVYAAARWLERHADLSGGVRVLALVTQVVGTPMMLLAHTTTFRPGG